MFLNSHGTFSKIDYILGHKTYLNKFKKTEIRQCLFSDHKRNKLTISNRKIIGKSQKTGGLKTHF